MTEIVKQWLKQKEAMELLGCKRTTLFKLRRDGYLKWSTIGRKVYISSKSIDELLESNSSAPPFFSLNKKMQWEHLTYQQ